MSESTQKTKKFPRWILELFTFIFIPYLIVYISSPVIFGILLFISIPIFIFLYFRLTNYIINSENPAGHKKLNLPQTPKPKLPTTQKKSRPIVSTIITSLISFPVTFIITCFCIYISEPEDSNTIQNFLDQAFHKYGPMEILAVLTPTFIYPLLVFASISKQTQNSSKEEMQAKKTSTSSKKQRKKLGKEQKNSHNESLLSTFSKHSKILISSSTILGIIAYISVLRFNLESANGDVGTALQITSIQFSENKFKWIAQLSIYTLLAYLTSLPALLMPELKKYILSHHSTPVLKNLNTKNPAHLCITLILLSTALTTLANICITALFLPASKDNIGLFLISAPLLSYLLCSISITLTINRTFMITSPQKEDLKSGMLEMLLWLLVGILMLVVTYAFMIRIPYNLGRSIANPGEALGSSETTYDCIFPVDPKSRESIAFGVIAESKPESVSIFTPTYSHKNNNYGHQKENGKKYLNKLTETHIKISGGYRIEKFDNDKHEYDLTSGKCIYKNSLPFYMDTYSWNKTV
jgi:membrane protein